MHLLFFLVSGVEVKRGFLGGLEGSKKESGPRLSLDGDKESAGGFRVNHLTKEG